MAKEEIYKLLRAYKYEVIPFPSSKQPEDPGAPAPAPEDPAAAPEPVAVPETRPADRVPEDTISAHLQALRHGTGGTKSPEELANEHR